MNYTGGGAAWSKELRLRVYDIARPLGITPRYGTDWLRVRGIVSIELTRVDARERTVDFVISADPNCSPPLQAALLAHYGGELVAAVKVVFPKTTTPVVEGSLALALRVRE